MLEIILQYQDEGISLNAIYVCETYFFASMDGKLYMSQQVALQRQNAAHLFKNDNKSFSAKA